MQYYMKTDSTLKTYQKKVQVNKKYIEVKDLLIAFKESDPKNKQRAAVLKEALSNQNAAKILDKYFKKL